MDSATVSLAQLLSGSFDVDGDQLSVRNVKASNGSDTAENKDGSWSINTKGESGEYKLVFDVTDGELSTKAEATVSVNHKPLFTTFEFLTTKVEAEEGQSRRLEIRRTGDTRTQQSIKLKLDGIESQQMTSNYLKSSSSKVVIKHLSILPLILMDSGKALKKERSLSTKSQAKRMSFVIGAITVLNSASMTLTRVMMEQGITKVTMILV